MSLEDFQNQTPADKDDQSWTNGEALGSNLPKQSSDYTHLADSSKDPPPSIEGSMRKVLDDAGSSKNTDSPPPPREMFIRAQVLDLLGNLRKQSGN